MGRQGWNHSSRGVVLNWKWFFCPPEDMCQYLETFLFVITGNWVLQTPGGRRPEMLLNILSCTGQHPGAKKFLVWNVNHVCLTEATQRTGLKDGQSLAGCPAQNGSAMFLVPPALQNFVTLPSRHGVYFIPLSMKFKRPSLFQQIECKGNSRAWRVYRAHILCQALGHRVAPPLRNWHSEFRAKEKVAYKSHVLPGCSPRICI